MRLIVQYVEGDGCTYSCENSIPFEYESAEKLLLDLEELASSTIRHDASRITAWATFQEKWARKPIADSKFQQWRKDYDAVSEQFPLSSDGRTIVSGSSTLFIEHFIEDGKFYPPNIYTVDEWFAAADL